MIKSKVNTSLFVVLVVLFSVFFDDTISNTLELSRRRYEEFLKKLGSESFHDRSDPVETTYPSEAALHNYITALDPKTKTVPSKRAFESLQEMKRTNAREKEASLQWHEQSSNIGGRTRAVMYDPLDPSLSKVWAGATTGGLWFNNNASDPTSPWHPVDDFWDNLVISSIVYDPNDPNVFYVGTGEPQTAIVNYRESSGKGIGIWKSTDAGVSWSLLPSTENFAYVTDMAIKNLDGNSVIYAGVISGVYQGKTHSSTPSDGLYKSEDDGVTWTQIIPNIPNTEVPYNVSDIEVTSGNRVFVGTMRAEDNLGGATILYTDDDINWTIFDDYYTIIKEDVSHPLPSSPDEYINIPGRVKIASAPSDPNRIYAVLASGYERTKFYNSVSYYMLKSSDAGASWEQITNPSDRETASGSSQPWATLCWHAMAASVDPNDPDRLYVGGFDLHRTDDGGDSWKWISDTWAAIDPTIDNDTTYVHADQHQILFKPGSSDEFIIANDGGLFVTKEGFKDQPFFTEINHNYNTLQAYSCTIHPEANKDYYIAGFQDNGSFLYTGENISLSNSIFSGDGAYSFIDEDDPGVQVTFSQFNAMIYTSDSFESSSENYDFYGAGLFINPMDYHSKSNTLIANAGTQGNALLDQVFVIENIGQQPNGRLINVGASVSTPFSAVKLLRTSAPDLGVLLGTQSGRIFKFDVLKEGSAQNIGSINFPTANISSIDVGAFNEIIIATFSNYGVSSVWLTEDGGATWEEKEGNLPDIPIRWGLFHPNNQNHVLLATELGVWSTENIFEDNVIWNQENNGMGNVRVDMVRMRKSDNKVIAATHGRGIYTSTYEVEKLVLGAKLELNDAMSIYPNPSTGVFSVQFNNEMSEKPIDMVVYNFLGQNVDRQVVDLKSNRTIDISHLSKGTYLLKFEIDQLVKTVKHVIR